MNLKEFKELIKGRRVAAHVAYGMMVDVTKRVAVEWLKECHSDHCRRPDIYPLPKVSWSPQLVAIGSKPEHVSDKQPAGWESAEVLP